MWTDADETFYERHAVVCMVVLLILAAGLFVAPRLQSLLQVFPR